MRAFAARAVPLSLVLVACSGDHPTGLDGATARPAFAREAAAAPISQPLSGRCETEFTEIPISPTRVRHIDTGTCWVTHLGRTTVLLSLVIDFVGGTLASDELTYTAANGDVLRAAIEGTFTVTGPTTVSFSGSQTFIGGTGRFAQASGSAPFEGTADLAAGTSAYSFDGRIAYAASDRSGTQ